MIIKKYDFDTLLNDYLPIPLRNVENLSWLTANLVAIRNQYIEFNYFQEEFYRDWIQDGSVLNLEFILNTKINLTGGTIRILHPNINRNTYVYIDGEYTPVEIYIFQDNEFMSGITETYLYLDSELTDIKFYVNLPTQFINDITLQNRITIYVNRFAKPGFSWTFSFS